MAQDVDEFVEVVALLVAISGGDDFERKMDIEKDGYNGRSRVMPCAWRDASF